MRVSENDEWLSKWLELNESVNYRYLAILRIFKMFSFQTSQNSKVLTRKRVTNSFLDVGLSNFPI